MLKTMSVLRRAERRAVKEAKRKARKAERMQPYQGRVSDIDPTMRADQGQTNDQG